MKHNRTSLHAIPSNKECYECGKKRCDCQCHSLDAGVVSLLSSRENFAKNILEMTTKRHPFSQPPIFFHTQKPMDLKKLKDLRKQRKITIKQMADKIMVSPSTINRLESGDQNVAVGTIIDYTNALDMEMRIIVKEK